MTNDELKRLQAECKHDGIISAWHFDDGQAVDFWSCENCGHRFVPLDLDMERDAKRYRWLRDWAQSTMLLNYLPGGIDSAIDEAMK